jgi:hypothetical protein
MINDNYLSELSVEYNEAIRDICLEWLTGPVSHLDNESFDELVVDVYNLLDGCFFE